MNAVLTAAALMKKPLSEDQAITAAVEVLRQAIKQGLLPPQEPHPNDYDLRRRTTRAERERGWRAEAVHLLQTGFLSADLTKEQTADLAASLEVRA